MIKTLKQKAKIALGRFSEISEISERLVGSGTYKILDPNENEIGLIRWVAHEGEGTILLNRGVVRKRMKSITVRPRSELAYKIILQLSTAPEYREGIIVDFANGDDTAKLIQAEISPVA